MWVATQDLPWSAAHPFYRRLNQILERADFDAYVELLCQRCYADEIGRPGLPPGRYFRILLLGYFEGLDSERAIAWRAADSLSVRSFLGLDLHEAPPDHSTVSRTRRLIDIETHQAVFTWVLQRLAAANLVKGKTIGIDATTLVVGDKGYHSNQALVDLEAVGLRSYISEPDRGRRNWKKHPEARDPVYRNRRRIRAERGKRLLRQRGERLERPFAHLYETGRMRRVHLRGHVNILKRVLLHACALNLGLLMRTLCGVGTPRSLQGCATMLLDVFRALIRLPEVLWPVIATRCLPSTCLGHRLAHRDDRRLHMSVRTVFTTGC